MKIGEIIKEKRKEKGLSINEVAKHLGVDESLISKFEKGTRKIQPTHIDKLSKLLKIPSSEMKSIKIMQLTDEIVNQYKDNPLVKEALSMALEIISEKPKSKKRKNENIG